MEKNHNEKKRLLLLGGGGHCHSVLDCALALNCFDEIGIIDSRDEGSIQGIKIVGRDDDLLRLRGEGWNCAFVSVGSVGSTVVRRRLYEKIREYGFRIPVIADPTAIISPDTRIGEGAFIGKGTIVNAGCSVGACAILNTGAILEHDCIIGDFAHISPGAVLCGHVVVGHDSHIGAGSTVRQEITIGSHTLVGIGSAVVTDLPDRIRAWGTPCIEHKI